MVPRRPGSELPSGTLTFLFTDIEGSTRLLQGLGRERWQELLNVHNRLLRLAIEAGDGVEVGTEGDAFFAVFPTAIGAVRAAAAAQRGLSDHPWAPDARVRVRMGIHTGEGVLGGDDYVGLDVHRAARIAGAAHGGQVLLSHATRTLVEDDLLEEAALRDLGMHRLKDLDRPERLYQLVVDGLPAEFPPPRTLQGPSNLPAELTSFVGRERELRRTIELLAENRLLTLTGPGGSGKTRLALRAASAVRDTFQDGVFLVPLEPVSDHRLVPRAIASVLGIRDEGPMPIEEVLGAWLVERAVLLVLDNVEQVIEAAPTVTALLERAPQLRVLVTSRAPLRVRGERELPVPPLALPDLAEATDPAAVSRFEAVALFVDRASAVSPAFALTEQNVADVAALCARLDGLPLGIELAASRISLLFPRAMLERLDRRLPLPGPGPRDVPARQATLRGAIGWSYDLLPAQARALFRRLSVFAGGWTLDAAEVVANPDGELGLETLDELATLVDNSLARREEPAEEEARFGMLQTIREFGLERLDADDDAEAIHRRHAQYFMSLAEAAEPHLRGPEQGRLLAELELEHDNIRAALRWATTSDEGEVGLRLVASLWRFWHLKGHLSEGRRRASEILALPSARPRNAARARALTAAGGLAYWQFDVPSVREAYEEALAIFTELGDRFGVAEATYNMAFAHGLEEDVEGARALIEESRSRFEEMGNRRGAADTIWFLSLLARLRGDPATARTYAEESLRAHRELGDRFGMTDALHMVGRAAFELGDLQAARASFRESLDLNEATGNRSAIAIAFENLAAQENELGRSERAVRLAGAADGVKELAGGAAPANLVALPDPREVARRTLSEEQVLAAWQEGRAMTLEQALAYARQEL